MLRNNQWPSSGTRILLSIVIITLKAQLSYARIADSIPQSSLEELKEVYIFRASRSQEQVLRLFKDDTYEFLQYTKTGSKKVLLYVGKVTRERHRFELSPPEREYSVLSTNSLSKVHEEQAGKRYPFRTMATQFVGKKGLYKSKLRSIFGVGPYLPSSSDAKYQRQWYINPITGEQLIPDHYFGSKDLDVLVASLSAGCKKEKDIALSIASFVIDHFNYGYGKYKQDDVQNLVFSDEKQPLAVCAGYSMVFEDLGRRALLETRYVTGAVRTKFSDIFVEQHEHAWNHARIDGVWKPLDVTWSGDTDDFYMLPNPKDLILTHFEMEEDTNLAYPEMTLQDFSEQPLIYPLKAGVHSKVTELDKKHPLQWASEVFTLTVPTHSKVNAVHKVMIDGPYAWFDCDRDLPAGTLSRHMKKADFSVIGGRLSIPLDTGFNLYQIDISSMGTLHYAVYNGTEESMYRNFIWSMMQGYIYSEAIAFLSCAKLKDKKAYEKLKLTSPLAPDYEVFIQQAQQAGIDRWKVTLFQPTSHYSYGPDQEYLWSWSMKLFGDGSEQRIWFRVNEEGSFDFAGIAEENPMK